MWTMIVLIPDHYLSIYFTYLLSGTIRQMLISVYERLRKRLAVAL